MPPKLKSNFAIKKKYGAFYTGGRIQVSSDGEYMFCGCGNKVQVLECQSGNTVHSIHQEEEEITSFALSPDDAVLVIATQQLVLRQWDWREETLVRTWKAIHTGPITTMEFDSTTTLLATGSADSTVKVWDIINRFCTHNLRGHQGVISVMRFHPDTSRLQLITAAADYKIHLWDLKTSTLSAILDAHYSVITGLVLSCDGDVLVSCSRDRVLCLWNLQEMKLKKVIPVYETHELIFEGHGGVVNVESNTDRNVETANVLDKSCDDDMFDDEKATTTGKSKMNLELVQYRSVESIIALPETSHQRLGVLTENLHVVTAGNKGFLRIWNTATSDCVYKQEAIFPTTKPKTSNEEADDGEMVITQTLLTPSTGLITMVTHDHNILLFDAETFLQKKQFSGYNQEVLDVQFLNDDNHLVVATNSELIKVFNSESWDCQLLHGHTDIVLCIDVCSIENLVASGSKDSTFRVWAMNSDSHRLYCVGIGSGHTHAVGALAFSRLSASFLISGSKDCTIKKWTIPASLTQAENNASICHLTSTATEKAHDKDINSITVAPNDKLIATGSQDQTAKLWQANNLTLMGVFRGHKRGIWCVQFSPVDQCLATSSADGTIKIWALSDFTCVKTFEGHDSSVLRVEFLCRGAQILSSGSDGLVKLWTIKTSECEKTFDEHEDKVWALCKDSSEEIMVTGSGDSSIIVWKDVTETEKVEEKMKKEKFILQEQELSNLVHEKKYLKAIGLAITLEQPFKLLGIIKEILSQSDGEAQLNVTLGQLKRDQMDALLRFAVKWNTNSRHCHHAQYVLSVLLKAITPENLLKFPNIKSSLEGLIPYTERHFNRMNRLLQQATFVDYTLQCVKYVHEESSSTLDIAESTFSRGDDKPESKPPVIAEQTSLPASTEELEKITDLALAIRKAVKQRLDELGSAQNTSSEQKRGQETEPDIESNEQSADANLIVSDSKTVSPSHPLTDDVEHGDRLESMAHVSDEVMGSEEEEEMMDIRSCSPVIKKQSKNTKHEPLTSISHSDESDDIRDNVKRKSRQTDTDSDNVVITPYNKTRTKEAVADDADLITKSPKYSKGVKSKSVKRLKSKSASTG